MVYYRPSHISLFWALKGWCPFLPCPRCLNQGWAGWACLCFVNAAITLAADSYWACLLSTKTPNSFHYWVMSLPPCSYAVGILGSNSDLFICCHYYYLLLCVESLLYTRGTHFRYAYIDIFYQIFYSLLKLSVGIIIYFHFTGRKPKLRKVSNFPKVAQLVRGRILLISKPMFCFVLIITVYLSMEQKESDSMNWVFVMWLTVLGALKLFSQLIPTAVLQNTSVV